MRNYTFLDGMNVLRTAQNISDLWEDLKDHGHNISFVDAGKVYEAALLEKKIMLLECLVNDRKSGY